VILMGALQADCATLQQIHDICFSFFNNRSGHSYISRMNTQRREKVPMSDDWEGSCQKCGHCKLIVFNTSLKKTVIEIGA
jgi:hypothetical protein